MRRACLWLLQIVFIAAVAAPLGCGTTTTTDTNNDDQVENVRLAIALPTEAKLIGQRSASGKLSSAQSERSASAAITDVSRILVDITNVTANPNRVIFRNTELVRGNDGIWSATLPFLPRAVMLEFRSYAYNTGGTMLFTGVTQQTLVNVNTAVTIPLNPADNGNTLVIPRISRISVPTELSSGGSGSITVGVEGSSGEVIRFTATPAANGGEIFPQTGQITLAGTSGSLVFQYTAPVLSTQQSFDHTIQIENPRGTRIQSNFTTTVLQVGQTASTSGTQLRVQFSPIINNLVARRIPNTSNVEWSAQVSDDRPTDQDLLTYAWSFSPVAASTTSLTGTTRTSVMTNYDTSVSGTIQLKVTDADNGITTLNWTLPVNQFLNQSDLIVDVTNVGGLANLVAGGTHSCARLTTGGIRCWGRGNEGQLGYGTTTSYGNTQSNLPYLAGTIPGLEKALQIGAGSQHTCALFDNGQVACWGRNLEGQLGYNTIQAVGDSESVASYGYVNVGGNVSRIAVGGKHTCAVLDTGNVRCWGLNNHGQLGYGNGASTATNNTNIGDNEAPYTMGDVVLGGALVADVVAGDEHTCVLLRDGNVRCWGRNTEGQLGYGRSDDIGDNEVPLTTNLNFNGATVRQLSAGANHTCALLTNGAVRCWGQNNSGQIGIAQFYTNAANSPSNLTLKNWGDDANETPYNLQTTYGDVNFGAGRVALQISTGANHTCATLDTGAVVCWGFNTNGELGLGDTTVRSSPPFVVPATNPPSLATVHLGASVVRLASGANHNCALLTTGGVRCWGKGADGQLGYGTPNNIGDGEQADAAGPVSLLGP